MAKFCSNCGEKIKFLESSKISNGYLDKNCAVKVIDKPYEVASIEKLETMTLSECQEIINNGTPFSGDELKEKRLEEKNKQKKSGGFSELRQRKNRFDNTKEEFQNNGAIELNKSIIVDENNKKIMAIFEPNHLVHDVYNFSDIFGFNMDISEKTTSKTKKKHAIARGVVGGTLGGFAGSVIGSGSAKSQTISIKNISSIDFQIRFNDKKNLDINFEGNKDDIQKANELNMILEKIMKDNKNSLQEEINQATNNFGQIKELKELLDIGAITQEEFDLKKKELLGI